MRYFNEVLAELYENGELVFPNEMIEYVATAETEEDLAVDVPYFYQCFRDEIRDIQEICGDFRTPTLSSWQTFEDFIALQIMEFIWYKGMLLN